MNVAVTDACIFIDLIELRLLSHFFGLDLNVNTTTDVFNELYPEQQELLRAYKSVDKLTIHNISPEEWAEIALEKYPKSLSDSDKTVLYIANKINAIVLSSDKTVRNYSKQNSITFHGILWIFDKFIEGKLLSGEIAILKINELILRNIIYKNNTDLSAEIEKRIVLWSK
jgi:hypothetical protein